MGRKKRRTRRINGAGSVTLLSGHRTKPWMVRAAGEIQIDGTIKRPIIGYYKTREEAEIGLAKYKINPYNLEERTTTFGELYEVWITDKEKDVIKITAEKYKKEYSNHLAKIGIQPIRVLKFYDFQNILNKVPQNTSITLKTIIKGVYKLAMKQDLIDKDISALLENSKFTTKKVIRTMILNEDVKKIRKLSNFTHNKHIKDVTDMLLILLYSGMRIGEVLDLKVKNIFLDENYMIGGIKTEAGIDRIIPIHSKIKDIIIRHYNPEHVYLFETKDTRYTSANFKKHFKNVKNRLEIEFNTHSARHTVITKLQRTGISEGKLKKIVGHKSKDITDGVYTHYNKDDLLIEIEKISYEE